jgi:hypothetical protein
MTRRVISVWPVVARVQLARDTVRAASELTSCCLPSISCGTYTGRLMDVANLSTWTRHNLIDPPSPHISRSPAPNTRREFLFFGEITERIPGHGCNC